MMKKNDSVISLLKAVITILAIILAIWLITAFFVVPTKVDGMSMYPTLEDGEIVFTNKNVYRTHDPQRFDIVIFEVDKSLSENGQYVKRIIGLPGERVRIDMAGNIYINDEILTENYGYETIQDPGDAIVDITVKEGEYFCLGDNRNHSEDSRFSLVGNIPLDRILGRVQIRLWPISKYGYIDLFMERKNLRND